MAISFASTVWKLGEHQPDDKGSFEADCLICGQRWPCESYHRLMDYAAAGMALDTDPTPAPNTETPVSDNPDADSGDPDEETEE